MKALVLNAVGRGFDLEDVDIAAPMGREVLIDVQASGLCHTDLLFATHSILPTPAVLGHEISGIVAEVGHDGRELRVDQLQARHSDVCRVVSPRPDESG
jgi:S-(hydroxymethyl)glutathione dehydrogenase / alcohol dehydrogenase